MRIGIALTLALTFFAAAELPAQGLFDFGGEEVSMFARARAEEKAGDVKEGQLGNPKVNLLSNDIDIILLT